MTAGNDQQQNDAKKQNPYSDHIAGFSINDLTEDPAPAKFIWPGIPDEAGKVAVLVGAGGLGKSALTVGLAVRRALGLEFLGRATKPGTTVIISKEDSRLDYRRKLAAQRALLGGQFVPEKVRDAVMLLDIVGDPALLVEPGAVGTARVNDALVQLWADAIVAAGPRADLIILETAARLTPSEDNAGLSALVSACELLGRLTQCAVLLVHHTGKEAARSGIADSYTGRGGSSLADNARAVMVLSPYPKEAKSQGRLGVALPEEMADGALVLSIPKLNGAPPPPPLVIEKVATRWALCLKAVDAKTLADADAASQKLRVAEGIAEVAKLVQAACDAGRTVTRRSIEKREVDGIDSDRFPLAVLKDIITQALKCGALIEGPGSRKGCTAITANVTWHENLVAANEPTAESKTA